MSHRVRIELPAHTDQCADLSHRQRAVSERPVGVGRRQVWAQETETLVQHSRPAQFAQKWRDGREVAAVAVVEGQHDGVFRKPPASRPVVADLFERHRLIAVGGQVAELGDEGLRRNKEVGVLLAGSRDADHVVAQDRHRQVGPPASQPARARRQESRDGSRQRWQDGCMLCAPCPRKDRRSQ
jgi:hypothetical protein